MLNKKNEQKERRQLPRSISRDNQIDQGKALRATIKAKDPDMKNAFTPEVAEKLS